jgi:PadR family transcriptional regulator, regulatory protein PadR
MTDKPGRELTTLEYTILGLLGMQPQTGYDIISTFESGVYRWSASAGSIYPVLKRLEKQRIVTSRLEMVHEARPRKVYSLLPAGEALLDAWLRQAPTLHDVIENYDIALYKFVFAECRLTRTEVLVWLDVYAAITRSSEMVQRIMNETSRQTGAISLHQQLAADSIALEIKARLAWIELAQQRLNNAPDNMK